MIKRIAFLVAMSLTTAIGMAQDMSQQWTGTWATTVVKSDKQRMPASGTDLSNSSVRQVIHASIGGKRMRLQLSNEYCTVPVEIKSVYVADWKDSCDIDVKTAQYLTFEGKRNVVILPGKAVYCDPISYNLKPLQRLTITINYGGGLPEVATLHDGSRTTSYIIKGESKPKTKFANAEKAVHWYNIAALEVEGNGNSIAVLGNSITDGRGSTTDMQNRWTDIFAEALQKKGKDVGVLNLGIGGNCVLWDGLGAAAVKRFDRDILGQKGVKALIIFEGVNDLGCSQDGVQTATRLIDSYKEMATKARKAGMKVYGATIMPFKGHDYYKPEHELGRKIVNLWIRESGYFDGYIDFDKLARDGNDPDALRKEWQEDWLHPNAEGYRIMGEYAAEVMESCLGQ